MKLTPKQVEATDIISLLIMHTAIPGPYTGCTGSPTPSGWHINTFYCLKVCCVSALFVFSETLIIWLMMKVIENKVTGRHRFSLLFSSTVILHRCLWGLAFLFNSTPLGRKWSLMIHHLFNSFFVTSERQNQKGFPWKCLSEKCLCWYWWKAGMVGLLTSYSSWWTAVCFSNHFTCSISLPFGT